MNVVCFHSNRCYVRGKVGVSITQVIGLLIMIFLYRGLCVVLFFSNPTGETVIIVQPVPSPGSEGPESPPVASQPMPMPAPDPQPQPPSKAQSPTVFTGGLDGLDGLDFLGSGSENPGGTLPESK